MIMTPPASSAKEARMLFAYLESKGEYLEDLGGVRRVNESTLGAAKNIGQGALQVVSGKGGRSNGALRIAQGGLDLFDILPSAGADFIRSVSNMPTGNAKPASTNIGRAWNDGANIEWNSPEKAINGSIAWTAGMVHALFFKIGSDALKLARDNN